MTQREVENVTNELLRALVSAPDERKVAALRVLRGEVPSMDAETVRRCSGQAEPFLTLKECAKRLGVSACSLWRWGVPGHELGGRRRFRMTEVEAYLGSDEFKRMSADLRKQEREKRPEMFGTDLRGQSEVVSSQAAVVGNQ